MLQHFSKLILLAFMIVGCGVTPQPSSQTNISKLSSHLYSLDKTISKSQSQKLAKDIFAYTQKLTKDFKLTSPPLFHNFLVNVGIREKGLCYDWSDALYIHLSHQDYQSFDFHLMGANIGEYWSEHNAMIVVAKGKTPLNGIIIDPWRDSGKLYFSHIKDDKRYSWKWRKEREVLR